MGAGRPKKTVAATLKKGWQDDIINLYKIGASNIEIKAYIWETTGSFSCDLWERWNKEEKEFSEIVKAGKMISNAWWEKNGRENIQNKGFNYTGWYMNMKNRFGWKDRQDITSNDKPVDNKFSVKIIKPD